MDTPNRIGLVSNGYGGWRLWSKDEPGMGGRDHPDAEYILLSEHDRIVAEKDAEIARLHDKLFVAWTVIETLRARLETARNDALDAAEIRALK